MSAATAAQTSLRRLTRQLSDDRASHTAKDAVALYNAGKVEEASRKLREAAALSHNNVDVQAAFLTIHDDHSKSPLLDLCRRYAVYFDQSAGEDAAKYLKSTKDARIADNEALDSLKVVLDSRCKSLTSDQDFIVAELARRSHGVRSYIATQLDCSTTEFFENIYDRGDDAANSLRSIVLEPAVWSNEQTRLRVEDDLFQLFMAKLMESGHDHDGRALKGIALLLIADTQRLTPFIDEEAFDALLTSLDFRLPADVRGQATLVLSKFLEISEQTGSEWFTKFVNDHIHKQKGDDLILVFSAGANLFPVASSMVAPIFLSQGLLKSVLPLLNRKYSSTVVHDSFLALINAACIDATCRTSIAEQCSTWLSHKISNGEGKQPALAATIVAKLRTSGVKQPDQMSDRANEDVSDLVDLFTHNLKLEDGKTVSDSIEGLAYTSLKSEIKERLVDEDDFLKTLFTAIDHNANMPEVVIGGLSIVSNLTHYAPNLTDEQQRISQLKAYANASKPTGANPLEDDDHVRARCHTVVEAGVMPVMGRLAKGQSSATAHLTDKILLSLCKNPKDRGVLAQQGAVKVLVAHAQSELGSQRSSPSSPDAAHALARILISLNPAHVLPNSGRPHITDAVSCLTPLLKTSHGEGLSDGPRDLLPAFEALLALTNLASSPDQTAAQSIIKQAWDDVENLLLSNNSMLQRASTELICNLVVHPSGIVKFADGSKRAKERLKLLSAMADVEDTATRQAAGGALAMLTEHDELINALLDLEHVPDVLLSLCEDDDMGTIHRGLVCVRNCVCAEGELGKKAQEKFRSHQGQERLKQCLKKCKDPSLLQIGVEAVKALM